MKICYIEPFGHIETIGTYLYYFYKRNIKIDFYINDVENVFHFLNKQINNYFNIYPFDDIYKNIDNYDKIICGTTDYVNGKINKYMNARLHKLITVYHTKCYIRERFNKNIVYNPNCIINNKCNHILPIHKLLNIDNVHDIYYKNILIIGQFKYKNINDYKALVELLDKYNIRLYVCVRNMDMVPQYNSKNLIIKCGLKYNELYELLQNIHFILPLSDIDKYHYHNNTMSGSIPLAFNHNIPLILDKKLAEIFNIKHSINYDKSVVEILNNISTINKSEYENIKEKLKKDKEDILKNNFTVLDSIFNL